MRYMALVLLLFANTAFGSDPAPLRHLLSCHAGATEAMGAFKGLRAQAQREAGYTLALQTAVRWRYDHIDKQLLAVDSQLDRIFNFQPLMLDQGLVLPAVIREAGAAWRFDASGAHAASTLTTFLIDAPARLVSKPPTWRQYLIAHYDVSDVNAVLYPRDDQEQAVWQAAVRTGWNNGITQANRLFETALARLTSDYTGMLRFHLLATEDLVSVPVVKAQTPSIIVNGHQLDVGERQFALAIPATWRSPDQWQPKPGFAP